MPSVEPLNEACKRVELARVRKSTIVATHLIFVNDYTSESSDEYFLLEGTMVDFCMNFFSIQSILYKDSRL